MNEQAWIRFWDAWCRTPRPWLSREIEDRVREAMRQAWMNGHGNGKVDATKEETRDGYPVV